jgi:flagellum-specific peptidoglycan hydrolase FlgJ
MASDMQKQFIREIGPIIREEAAARGYQVASPIIAQATVESFKGAGLSTLASKYHNYFGMKAGSKWAGPTVNLKTGRSTSPA